MTLPIKPSGGGRGLFVSSTGTEVGKTVIASGIACWLHVNESGRNALWKPVQSGVHIGSYEADSYRLLKGSGLTNVQETDLVTWTLREPLAPWAAAEREGLEIDIASLLEEGERRLAATDTLIIEGAGGVAVPLNATWTMSDLAAALHTPMLIVAPPLLGTVSHTVTAVLYARSKGVKDIAVVFTAMKTEQPISMMREYEQQLQENANMITSLAKVPVLGILPYLPHPTSASETAWHRWRYDWLKETAGMRRMYDWLNLRLISSHA